MALGGLLKDGVADPWNSDSLGRAKSPKGHPAVDFFVEREDLGKKAHGGLRVSAIKASCDLK